MMMNIVLANKQPQRMLMLRSLLNASSSFNYSRPTVLLSN